jgi:hypothetical protein
MYYHAAVVCLQPHRPISQYAAERIGQNRFAISRFSLLLLLRIVSIRMFSFPLGWAVGAVKNCNATRETHLSRDRRARARARVSFIDAMHLACRLPVPYGRPYCQGNGSPGWTEKESATVVDRWWFSGCIVSPSANEAIRSRPPSQTSKCKNPSF